MDTDPPFPSDAQTAGAVQPRNVRAALSAAVDDGHLPRNPCAARSVRPPTVDDKRVVPWTPERVFAVRAAMPERYQAMVDLGGGSGFARARSWAWLSTRSTSSRTRSTWSSN